MIFSITESCDIFSKAQIIAREFFVISTLPASASNSFFLDIARFISGSKIIDKR